jgi:hypothetical protein
MWLFDTFFAVAITVIGHAGLCRVSMPLNVVARFLVTGGVVGACLVWRLLVSYGTAAPQTWAGALTFAFACEFYLFLFTLAITSVSANLLAHLSRRAMTNLDIEQLYDSRQMVAARLDRLIAGGLLAEGPTGLRLTAEGARTVRTFRRLRDFFRHPLPTYDLPADD